VFKRVRTVPSCLGTLVQVNSGSLVKKALRCGHLVGLLVKPELQVSGLLSSGLV
jgi:hypothetical protein